MPVMQRLFNFALFDRYSQLKNDPRYNQPRFQLKQFSNVPVEHIESNLLRIWLEMKYKTGAKRWCDSIGGIKRLSIQNTTFIHKT
jgi:hypothetical protein